MKEKASEWECVKSGGGVQVGAGQPVGGPRGRPGVAAVLGGAGAGEPAGAGAGPPGGLPPLPPGQVRLPGLVHGAQPQQRGQLRLHAGVWIWIDCNCPFSIVS